MSARGDLGASLGARTDGEGTRFALFATTARRCAVRLFDERGGVLATLPMKPRGDGLFELSTAEATAGALYKFVLDERELPDPYARSLPRGVHGPAKVEASRYAWRHGPGVHRPLGEQVIYELHVGAFTPEGTWAAAASRLRSLRDLGVTTVELMPVAAFAGERGWGYDGVAPFAPFAPYGTPDGLRALVDEAHGLGLGVLLDVVYNHLGPAGNYLPAYSPGYFAAEGGAPWGDAPDCGRDPMRSLVLDNARYWLEEFRFDGLRIDAAHAIVDGSSRHVLRDLVAMARALPTGKTIIAEDDRNDPDLVAVTGLDGVWADDFHHAVRVTLTGERDGYYAAYEPGVEAIARAINSGWIYQGQPSPLTGRPRGRPAPGLDASAFVYCIQNHDQVGNRALGERLDAAVSVDAYRMASALLLFLPMTPLLFMGQEWAASTPFLYFTDHEPELGAKVSGGRREEFKRFRAFADPAARRRIPDPQDRETFERSRLRWEERDRGEHARTLRLYRDLLSLRRGDPVLRVSTREGLRAEAEGSVLRVIRASGRDERVLLANFSDRRADPGPLRPPGSRVLLSTADPGDDGLAPWSAVVLAGGAAGEEARYRPGVRGPRVLSALDAPEAEENTMSKATPTRPDGNNFDVSTGRVTTDDDAQTTHERPAGLPNERTGREWDDKIDGVPGAAHNLKRQAQDTPAALETVEPGQTPSRKSTRRSTSHLKAATPKTTAVRNEVRSPSARAQRAKATTKR